jgi:hypothetical protein
LLTVFSLLFVCSGCKEKVENEVDKEERLPMAVESNDWNRLFIHNDGWFGGDGIFGIPLDGKEFVPATDSTVTLFTFGDTMIGSHDGKVLLPENFKMINNSVGVLKGNKPDIDHIVFHWKETENGEARALFKPNTPNSGPEDYYWLGDGFVNVEGDGKLYIFAYPIHNKESSDENGFSFEQIGVNLLSFNLDHTPPYKEEMQLETPFFDRETQTSFGSAIYVNTESAGAPNPDGYVYTYAVSNLRGVKGLLVARVYPKDFVDFKKWRFWNGTTWVTEMQEATFVAKDVSNEMSVSPLDDGRIVLTYQRHTMGPEVAIQIGKSLIGPFGEQQVIYEAPEFKKNDSYFTYNAKAYPHLSEQKSLLISYNVNSFNFWSDILRDPILYRPRFIKIQIE